MFSSEETLWVEKYRPTTLKGYVGNPHIVEKVKNWIENNDLPHILLYGPAGTGKTTLAKIIASEVDASIMFINASDENNVDTFRNKVKEYASNVGFHKWKIVLLDEADYLTPQSMAILRNMMEEYPSARFILTCNFKEKIIDPILSRCQSFQVIPPDKKQVALRMIEILKKEKVSYEIADVGTAVTMNFPDIRRIINFCQRQVVKGTLTIDGTTTGEVTYLDTVVNILKDRKDPKQSFLTIRQLIADSSVRDFSSLYRHLYENLNEFAPNCMGDTILILGEFQYKDALVVDKEINIMAMMYTLIQKLFTNAT
jgi:DNA polymerase III delta prime subunit